MKARRTLYIGVAVAWLLFGHSAAQAIQNIMLLGVGGAVSAAQDEGVPTGAILFIKSGACPTGFTEDTDVDGRTILGTLDANANVGGTGGADNITPAGTNSSGAVSAHSGTAVSAHSGTAVADHASHTHTYTDVVNHVHVQSVNSATTGGLNGYGVDTSTNTSTASGFSTANPTGGVATGTTAGPSATLTHSVTQPSAHSVTQPNDHTFTQPTFTGTQFDNRSAFIRLIACRKT